MDNTQKVAERMFAEPCIGKRDGFHAGNCQHCCLRGEGAGGTADELGRAPNYAGWERLYVQAGRSIPAVFAGAFLETLRGHDNQAYRDALYEDVKLYGATIEASI